MPISSRHFHRPSLLLVLGLRLVRLGFRLGSVVAPGLATRAAVWLFTRPHRSLPTDGELALLREARSYTLPFREGTLSVMEWGAGPTVLCVHGWSSRGSRFAELSRSLAQAGYRAVVFDAPAHGQSSGRNLDLFVYREAVRTVAQGLEPLYGLIGHSFGATACLLALEEGLVVSKVIFFSALNGIRGPVLYFCRLLRLPERLVRKMKKSFEARYGRTVESLEALQIVPSLDTPPLLLFHDIGDRILPFQDALDLVGVWSNSRLISTTGSGHDGILSNPHLIEQAIHFLDEIEEPQSVGIGG
ncbi:MAG: alpha/beta fold hydrolase [Acidobacteriota bacterium]